MFTFGTVAVETLQKFSHTIDFKKERQRATKKIIDSHETLYIHRQTYTTTTIEFIGNSLHENKWKWTAKVESIYSNVFSHLVLIFFLFLFLFLLLGQSVFICLSSESIQYTKITWYYKHIYTISVRQEQKRNKEIRRRRRREERRKKTFSMFCIQHIQREDDEQEKKTKKKESTCILYQYKRSMKTKTIPN